MDSEAMSSVASEEALLGAALIPDASVRVLGACVEQGIESEAFTSHERQLVYRSMLYLFKLDKAVDAITVSNVLAEYGQLENIGGTTMLNGLVDKCETHANAEHYLGIVKKKWDARKFAQQMQEALRNIQNGTDDPEMVAARLSRNLTDITEGTASKDSMASAWSDVEQQYKRAEGGEVPGLETPWPLFNQVIGGAPSGVLSIVGGREGTRKSFLVMQWALHAAMFAAQPRRGAYYAFEDNVKISMRRAACMLADASAYMYIHGRLPQDKLDAANKQGRMLVNSNLSFKGGRGRNVDQLIAEIKRGISRQGWQFVFLDAFKDVYGGGAGSGGEDKYKSSRLFDLAENCDIPVIVVHHVGKSPSDDEGYESKNDQYLSYRAIKGFTEITADARFIAMLQCRARRAKKGEIINGVMKHEKELVLEDFVLDLQKNNHGKTGQAALNLDDDSGRFIEKGKG